MSTDNRNTDLVHRFIRLPLEQRKLFLEKLASKGGSLAQLPIPQVRGDFEQLPLSYAQQRLWFLWKLDPASAVYNISSALRFKGSLDRAALQRAFDSLLARHDALRTTFLQQGGQVQQVVHPHLALTVTHEQLNGAGEEALREQVEHEARQGFDLEHGPLLRVKLLALDAHEHVLVLTLHHIIADGWSMPLMVEELVRLYEAYAQGGDAQLPALPIQYADYAIWQRSWMEAGEQARQLAYWAAQLGGEHPVLEMPMDRPRPTVSSLKGARLAIDLQAGLARALKQFAQQQGVTPFMLLLASFQVLLHRYSGQADIRVGVPVANRNRVETERLVGLFVNTQVLRAEFDLEMTFSDFLSQVKQRVVEAQAHQDLPFEQLVEALQPERSLNHSPLFQVMYNHQTQARGERRSLPGLEVDAVAWDNHTAKFDLTLETFEHETGIGAALVYATDLFDASTARNLARHWQNLLTAIVEQPTQRIADLVLLDANEHRQIIEGWNATQASYPNASCIHQLFEAQVAKTPDAPALIFGEQTLSYAALNRRANQLAHKLREQGVGPDVLVGIAMQRSLEMVVGLLAILKAGGAYVPLDPEYPQDRLEYMLEDSQAILLLSETSLIARMPGQFQSRTLLLDQLSLDGYPDTDLTCVTSPRNLVYCIYTSGSTGKPKGVQIEHRSVAALIGWSLSVYSQADLCGVLFSTSICFDLSVWELFVTLSAGGYAVLAGNALELPNLAAKDRVRLVNTVPSAIKQLCETGNIPPSVKTINLCGEALKQSIVDDLYRLEHVSDVYDLYGPSEDTTYSTCTLRAAGGKANIGRPLHNSAAYVLSGALQPVPVGAVGELYLAGAGLARGYLKRPGLSAERFIPNPFDAQGGRIYRTGDLARYRPDGVLEYVGRVDHQVKVRGFRIELGEIEVRLQQEAVREAVVMAVDGPAGQHLVAYVVPADAGVMADAAAQSSLRDNLRAALRKHLPEYMVPSYLLLLDTLPLTPNGKLDRKALPRPDGALLEEAHVPPRTPLQQQVAAIWAQVLKVERVGLGDNFFLLGGHSLIATQVTSRVQEQVGLPVSLKALFENPGLGDYCAQLEQLTPQADPVQNELAKSLEALKRLTTEEIEKLVS
ncbi:amino acid adenylation domain-containing protein [Pseudomonas putida]|uniref:non-ribosomal peptide synthetase n=1 Tax=Pseudomonas putida TaxID=303 RepID=UPI0018A8EF79|nr:non-ribosomal peptide synthetase [Pseudomonas putida]MBF8667870.1 amino acid adenylation domain-containing protein [Pseudomonas putida]MBF8714468.1 amino acid adenylation domain-containing protein [Pseudomonas putida]